MSKNGKLQKAKNIEKRRHQMQEALECLPLKEAARIQLAPVAKREPKETAQIQPAPVAKRQPKQCTAPHCQRYVDPSCTVCPYCGNPLQ